MRQSYLNPAKDNIDLAWNYFQHGKYYFDLGQNYFHLEKNILTLKYIINCRINTFDLGRNISIWET